MEFNRKRYERKKNKIGQKFLGLEPEIGPAKLREGETNHRGTGHIQMVHRPVDDGVHSTVRCQAKQNERDRESVPDAGSTRPVRLSRW